MATEEEKGPWIVMEDRSQVCRHGVDHRYFMRYWMEDGMSCSELERKTCRQCLREMMSGLDFKTCVKIANLAVEERGL